MSAFKAWQQPPVVTVKTIQKQYENGFSGVIPDPAADERLRSFGYATAEEAISDAGYADASAGQLVVPFQYVEQLYPKAYPGPAQKRGSCVSHANRNACLLTLACEVVAGLPDPISNKVEEAPEVSSEAEKAGVLAIEPAYHYRGHRGDGWWCNSAAEVTVKYTGAVLRKDYGFIDLTRLDPDYAGKYWQRDQIPRDAVEAFNDNLFRDAAEVAEFAAIRDLLSRGIGVNSCGSEGFSNQRDEHGVSARKGSWPHAMAIIGADDRTEIHRLYGGPLLLVQNSWSRWNSGPRKIYGTDIEIPEGCFWARWRDVKRRGFVAIAGLNGWARKEIPDWKGGW